MRYFSASDIYMSDSKNVARAMCDLDDDPRASKYVRMSSRGRKRRASVFVLDDDDDDDVYSAGTSSAQTALPATWRMDTARNMLRPLNLLLVDVPWDGSCAVWSVLPALSIAQGGLPMTKRDARTLLISVLRLDVFRADVERDLRQTNEMRAKARPRLAPYADVDELFDEWMCDDVYLPPILVARATEFFTRGRVRLYSIDNTNELFTLYESDGDAPYVAQLFFEPHIDHVARILSLPVVPRYASEARRRNFEILAKQRAKVAVVVDSTTTASSSSSSSSSS